MTSAQIDAMPYFRSTGRNRHVGVERASELFGQFRGTDVLFNVDRSWFNWPDELEVLAALDMADQMTVKCDPLPELVDAARAFDVKFPFCLMVRTPEEALAHLGDPDLNLIGLELIAEDRDHPFCDRGGFIAEIRAAGGVFAMVNAEVILEDSPLFGRWDDHTALFESPDAGYGPLFDLGVDVIQTDWPWLLAAYRATRRANPVDSTVAVPQ